jgi:hypothetical protein
MDLGAFGLEQGTLREVGALVEQGLDGRLKAWDDGDFEKELLRDSVPGDLTGGLNVGQKTIDQDKGPASEIVGQTDTRN